MPSHEEWEKRAEEFFSSEKGETVHIEVSIDTWNKLQKIKDDYFINGHKSLTTDEVIAELCYGRY
jgi:hypothetical protein